MNSSKRQVIKICEEHCYCNGKVIHSPHPKVYLKISKKNNEIVCPYCGITYKYHNTCNNSKSKT